MNLLSVENITKTFGARVIFKDLTFGVDQGQKVAIVAKNGSGKTTFFNILSGFLNADEGNITLNGAAIGKNEIAYIDAESFFYPKLTALEFLSVFPKTNLNYNEVELAKVFDLPLDEFIDSYSTGMKKKLLIISQLKQDKKIFSLLKTFDTLTRLPFGIGTKVT
jgi:ABC-2 type transport system ATP-binding protein